MARPIIDKTGKKYNKLSVIAQDGYRNEKKNSSVMWKCRCDCGNYTRVSGGDLVSGRQQACYDCGKNIQRKKLSKKNNIIDMNDHYKIDCSTSKLKNIFTLIDKEDLKKIIDEYSGIYAAINKGQIRISKTINKKHLYIHRIIMNCKEYEQVDHINGDTLDNRKSNLRICPQSENNKNAALRKDNKSGCPGVGWYKKLNKWQTRIKINNKDKHLGYFENIDDAIKVRKQAELEYGYHKNHGRAEPIFEGFE